MPNKPQHGEITVETTPGFEGWNVTATLFVDPKKLTEQLDHNAIYELVLKYFEAHEIAQAARVSKKKNTKATYIPKLQPHPIQCGGF